MLREGSNRRISACALCCLRRGGGRGGADRTSGVSKVYADGTEAVSELDLDVGDGEFMVFVGPSGCGKTTALRMVAGLEEITAGTVTIGDRVVNDLPPKDRHMAMVFQNYALYPHLNVFENMAFGLRLRKTPKEEIKRRVREAARRPRPHGIPRPQAEEPLRRTAPAGGDGPRDRSRAASLPDGRAALEPRREAARADALRDAAHPNGPAPTTVYVTHDQTEAMTMGDRVAVISRVGSSRWRRRRSCTTSP